MVKSLKKLKERNNCFYTLIIDKYLKYLHSKKEKKLRKINGNQKFFIFV